MLMMAATGHVMVCPSAPAEVPRAVQDAFAAVADFLRDLLDAVPDSTMTEMLGYGDTLNELLEPLKAEGHCLCVGVRKTSLMGEGWKQPLPVEVLYLTVALADQPARQMVVTK